jgi:S1-C subfamily serine protease
MFKKILKVAWYAAIFSFAIYSVQQKFVSAEESHINFPSKWPDLSPVCLDAGIYQRTVRVGTKYAYGSGLFIDSQHILTVAHLRERSEPKKVYEIQSYITPNVIYKAHAIGIDYYNDLMLLKLEKPIDFKLNGNIKVKMRVPGNTAATMGYHSEYIIMHHAGETFPVPACYDGITNGSYTAPGWNSESFVWPGMSGGPTIDVADGSLIGLNNKVGFRKEDIKRGIQYVKYLRSQHATGAAIARMLTRHKLDFTLIKAI